MNTAAIATPAPAESTIVADELVTDQGVYGLYDLARMRRSPDNRKRFNEAALQELAASIKAMGVAQPILIRPVTPTSEAPEEYEIVAGERRYRASIIAGLATIPGLCRNLSDLDAAKIRILENLQREDPHPIEEAEGYQLLMQQHGYNADQLAEEVSKSRSYIYGRLKLCALTEMVRNEFFENKVSASIALIIARIPVKTLQEKCLLEITGAWNGVMSYRDAARHIERNYMLDLKKAVFDIVDAGLVRAAGACTTCSKRAGNQPEVFRDVSADVCTDPVCFKLKGDRHHEQTKSQAAKAGTVVLSGDAAKKVMARGYISDLKGGYVAVDHRQYVNGEFQTYRDMLGKGLPATALLEDPREKTLHHVIQLDVLKSALEANGIKLQEKDTSSSAREREMEAAAKLEREYRKRLLRATHDASLMMNLVDPDLRLIAAQMFYNLPGGMVSKKFLMELYGWTDETVGHPYRENIRKAVDALTQAQLNQFIRDCSLCLEIDINVYTEPKAKPENMLAFAARTKVDAKKIRTDVDAEAQAKKEKKKPAAKKAPAAAAPPQPSTPADGIDLVQLQAADLVNFIKTNPDKINDLARAIIDRGTDALVTAFQDAAVKLGYAPYDGLYRLVEQVELAELAAPALDLETAQQADLVEFIRAYPERLDELTATVLSHSRGELVGMLQRAAESLGFVYGAGKKWSVPLQEMKPAAKSAWPYPTSSSCLDKQAAAA